MKRLIVASYIIFCNTVFAQKHDYQWLFGYANSSVGIDSFRGGVNLDFNYSPTHIYPHKRLAGFDMCNTSFCDNNGNLIMYSNGADIFDKRDSVMQGGDSLNFGWFWNYWITQPSRRHEGLRMCQSMLSLPDPKDSTQIYIVH